MPARSTTLRMPLKERFAGVRELEVEEMNRASSTDSGNRTNKVNYGKHSKSPLRASPPTLPGMEHSGAKQRIHLGQQGPASERLLDRLHVLP